MTLGLDPVQEECLDRLRALIESAARTGHGRVVFLAGSAGSGRSFWFDQVAEVLGKARIVAGKFVDGQYESGHTSARTRGVPADLDPVINSIAASGTLLGPHAALVGQFITVSLAAYRFVDGRLSSGQGTAVHELLPGALRIAAAEDRARPLVCLIDDADAADGNWWANLMLSLAQEIELELRLVLVMGINGPLELGDIPGEGESDACGVARSLIRRGLAEWWALRALSRPEIASWVGPASSQLLSAIWAINQGNPNEMRGLWDSWLRRGVIRRDDDDRWQIVGDIERTLAEAGDRFSAQLGSLLSAGEAASMEELREMLACAALEGNTFTAEAIARALNWDPDVLIDLLDDHLATVAGPLQEAKPFEIPESGGGKRTLWRYRFIRDLDRKIARVRFASPTERRDLARRLAPALVATYSPEEHRIAGKLATLLAEIGDVKAAEHFRRIARLGSDQRILAAQARYLVSADTDAWAPTDLRRASELLNHAGHVLYGVEPFSATLEFADVSADFAARAHAPLLQAEALIARCGSHSKLMMINEARADLTQAQNVLDGNPPKELEGLMLLSLGTIEMNERNLDAAQLATERGLKIFQEVGNRAVASDGWLRLGQIQYEQQDFRAALKSAERALAIAQQEGKHDFVAASSFLVGRAQLALGEFEAAGPPTELALKTNREIGSRQGESASLKQLGALELRQGDFDAAQQLTLNALKIAQEAEDRDNEVSMWVQLAEIELGRAGRVEARRYAEHALSLSREIGSRRGEALSRKLLERL